MQCPECGNAMTYRGMDDGDGDYGDDIVEIWECDSCGEGCYTPLNDFEWTNVIREWTPTPSTARGRIERAVQSVCEAAAKIRQKLTGNAPELPF